MEIHKLNIDEIKYNLFICNSPLSYLVVEFLIRLYFKNSIIISSYDKDFVKKFIKLGNQLKEKGKVIAIEPEPTNFKALEKNVKLNKLKNVYLKNVACSDKEGFIDFYIDYVGNYGGGHSLISNERSSRKKIKVKTQKLDNIIEELKIKKVDLIKIDVEGAESLVLKGALKTLKNSHPKNHF